MSGPPLVTVAVPSYNQGVYLDEALTSIFQQDPPVEVFVVDGGSTDQSLDVIRRWQSKLAGWRSHPDAGQSSAINEAIARGNAPFVCWLNSDDLLLPGALTKLIETLTANDQVPAAYGRAWNLSQKTGRRTPVWVREFSEEWFANGCFICQPATLIRRSAWEALGGLDEQLHMAMDYDLWWRLYRRFGPLMMIDDFLAVNREHAETKTRTKRSAHYREAMTVVKRHYGRIPVKWWLAQPYAVWWRTLTK